MPLFVLFFVFSLWVFFYSSSFRWISSTLWMHLNYECVCVCVCVWEKFYEAFGTANTSYLQDESTANRELRLECRHLGIRPKTREERTSELWGWNVMLNHITKWENKLLYSFRRAFFFAPSISFINSSTNVIHIANRHISLKGRT